jgi:hypothetical protein
LHRKIHFTNAASCDNYRKLSMNRPVRRLTILIWLLFFGGFTSVVSGDTSWINPSSGLWQDAPNWSFGLPNMSQPAIHIAFGGESKTITANAATPGTNLVIQRLNLSGPGVTNTLLLTDTLLEVRSTLEMRSGSALYITNSTLRLPSTGSSFDVNAGEVWLQSGLIQAINVSSRIGRDGGIALMRVDGGTARLNEVLVGRRVSRSGAHGSLVLSGGSFEVTGNFDVGADTNCLGDILVTGGELSAVATNFSTAIGEQGNGTMIVSNGVVRFDDVDVGRHTNAVGTYHVAGGSNWVNDLALARFPLSTGLVYQTDGRLSVDRVQVGQEGHGEMTVSGGNLTAEIIQVAGATNTASGILTFDGGTTVVRSNLIVGTIVSAAQVSAGGGTIAVTNEALSGVLRVIQGTAEISGGSLFVDQLQLPTPGGVFALNAGFLSSAKTAVSNGLPFVVGDGTNAATFHLRGGTHYFQDGLVISAHATLTGCGAIVGFINNQGTIATNCGPTAPRLLDPTYAGGFSAAFQSEAGFSYTVEHAATIDALVWDPLLVTNGTGSIIVIHDDAVGGGTRFYRLRAQ